MHVAFFRPELEASTVVVSPYGVNGNDQNTGPRYQREAELTGYDILGITKDGSNTLAFNPMLRLQLSPDNFTEYCAERADAVNVLTKNYDKIVWRGQSTGSFPALGMIWSGVARATHLVLEDGINTRHAANGKDVSFLRGYLEWLRFYHDQSRNLTLPVGANWQKVHGTPQNPLLAGIHTAVEQAHWSRLWRSSYSRIALLEIAHNMPGLPILAKFLGNTATGATTEIQQFTISLQESRKTAADTTKAELHTDYDPRGWHAYIEYPEYGKDNLVEAAAMKSYITL